MNAAKLQKSSLQPKILNKKFGKFDDFLYLCNGNNTTKHI